MHIYTRLLIATITAFTLPAYAIELESSQMVVDAPPEEVAVLIKDKPVTVETLTSYAATMQNLQGAAWDRPGDLLADYVFSSLASDLTLSGTTHVQEPRTIPSDYPSIGQRRFLKKKYDEHLRANLEVPQDVLESWFEQNKDNYTQPEKVHAYHIFMETSDDVPTSAPDAVRKKMEEVKSRADAGTSFSLLAEEFSEAASAQKGGEIGNLHRRMPVGPQSRPINLMLETALFNLNPGQTSDIMSTTFGLHLLYAHDRQPTTTVTMDDLITSKVLPNAASFAYLQDESRRLIAEFIKENDGAVAEFSEELTSDTASFRLGGTTFTVKHMEELYGPPFTRAYNQAKNSTETLAALVLL